jgi:lipopolysaccharide export system permease protein
MELKAKRKETENLSKRLELTRLGPASYTREVEVRRLQSMLQMAKDRQTDLKEQVHSLQVEFHKKFSISFAIVIFVLIGIPLGLMTRTSGIGMAFSVSSVIFLIYYIALNGGEQMADKGVIPPFVSMWLSNIVFLILAILLIIAFHQEKRIAGYAYPDVAYQNLKNRKNPPPDEIVH